MKLREFISRIISEHFSESTNSDALINSILDKINISGKHSLSLDERTYLSQYHSNSIDKGLENWLISSDDETFNRNGEKLLYDEFEDEEDIFYSLDKLKRIITKHLKQKPFTNNADWGGSLVWNISDGDDYTGRFIVLGDDELIVLNRSVVGEDEDEYEDEVVRDITNSRDLYNILTKVIKNDTNI
jgi:hypothetical protein